MGTTLIVPGAVGESQLKALTESPCKVLNCFEAPATLWIRHAQARLETFGSGLPGFPNADTFFGQLLGYFSLYNFQPWTHNDGVNDGFTLDWGGVAPPPPDNATPNFFPYVGYFDSSNQEYISFFYATSQPGAAASILDRNIAPCISGYNWIADVQQRTGTILPGTCTVIRGQAWNRTSVSKYYWIANVISTWTDGDPGAADLFDKRNYAHTMTFVGDGWCDPNTVIECPMPALPPGTQSQSINVLVFAYTGVGTFAQWKAALHY